MELDDSRGLPAVIIGCDYYSVCSAVYQSVIIIIIIVPTYCTSV